MPEPEQHPADHSSRRPLDSRTTPADDRFTNIDVSTAGEQSDVLDEHRRRREQHRAAKDWKSVSWYTIDIARILTDRHQYLTCFEDLTREIAVAEHEGQLDYQMSCTFALAGLYNGTAHYSQARTVLEPIVPYFKRHRQPAEYAYVLHTLGDTCRGIGLIDDAERAYEEARRIFDSQGMQDWYAHSTMHLAHLFPLDEPRTEQLYRQAHTLYTNLEMQDKAVRCASNLALVHLHKKEFASAEKILLDSKKFHEGNGDRVASAQTSAQLASLYASMGNPMAADQHGQQAAAVFLSAGLFHLAAQCDMNRAVDWMQRSNPTSAKLSEISRFIFDILAPAVLYRDSERHQYGTHAERLAWQSQFRENLDSLFVLADRMGDEQLLAGLIETIVNQCSYTLPDQHHDPQHTNEPTPAPTPPLATTNSDGFGGNIDSTVSTEPGAVLSAGAARLIVGARLPTEPPPLLRLADGSIALERYFHLAEERYAPFVNRDHPPLDVVTSPSLFEATTARSRMSGDDQRKLRKRSWFRRKRS